MGKGNIPRAEFAGGIQTKQTRKPERSQPVRREGDQELFIGRTMLLNTGFETVRGDLTQWKAFLGIAARRHVHLGSARGLDTVRLQLVSGETMHEVLHESRPNHYGSRRRKLFQDVAKDLRSYVREACASNLARESERAWHDKETDDQTANEKLEQDDSMFGHPFDSISVKPTDITIDREGQIRVSLDQKSQELFDEEIEDLAGAFHELKLNPGAVRRNKNYGVEIFDCDRRLPDEGEHLDFPRLPVCLALDEVKVVYNPEK